MGIKVQNLKKWNEILTITIGSLIGMYVGHIIHVCWRYKTRPEYYMLHSVPWYTSILIYGVLIGILLGIAIFVKIRIVKRMRKRCTGCRNRCLLSNPKCDKGEVKSVHVEVLRID